MKAGTKFLVAFLCAAFGLSSAYSETGALEWEKMNSGLLFERSARTESAVSAVAALELPSTVIRLNSDALGPKYHIAPPEPKQYEKSWRFKGESIAEKVTKIGLKTSIVGFVASLIAFNVSPVLVDALLYSRDFFQMQLAVTLIQLRPILLLSTCMGLLGGLFWALFTLTPPGRDFVKSAGGRLGAWLGRRKDINAHKTYFRTKKEEWTEMLSAGRARQLTTTDQELLPTASPPSTAKPKGKAWESAEERFKLR